jgi:hypothetical protein
MTPFIITTLILLPALYFIGREMINKKRKNSKRKTLTSAYERMVFAHKLSIEDVEDLETRIIALDIRNKKLMIIDHTKPKPLELCISLPEMAAIEVCIEKDDHKKYIQKVFLELHHKRKKGCTRFCFYDDAKDRFTDLPSIARQCFYWKKRLDIHKQQVVY